MQKIAFLLSFLMLSYTALGNEIIALERGLTLAEIRADERQTLLVVADHNNSVMAINISEMSGMHGGIVDSFKWLGYEGIAKIAALAQSKDIQRYEYDSLLSPAGNGAHHIALGFNYPEHAAEIEQEEEPFIFLKAIPSTREKNLKTEASVLLDYEIEICARPMQAIADSQDVAHTSFGFFVCGDFTDRAELLRQMDIDNMRSGRGFSAAKSKPGYFPAGPYLVIPKDPNDFLSSLSFSLWLNDQQRQSAIANESSWTLTDIITDIILADQTKRPTYSPATESWLLDNKITQDMTILTGTPHGVLMRPPSLGFKISSGMRYVFSGAFFNTDAMKYILERYIQKLQSEKAFLQPGDQLRFEARYLGNITMDIVD